MYQTTVNVVKTNGTMVAKILLPVLLWLFVATMAFPLVSMVPEEYSVISVSIMVIVVVAFIPVTVWLIKRGMKISKQQTTQRTVCFRVDNGKLLMDDQQVKVMKNPIGKRVDITCCNTADVFYIEMSKADEFLRFVEENHVL